MSQVRSLSLRAALGVALVGALVSILWSARAAASPGPEKLTEKFFCKVTAVDRATNGTLISATVTIEPSDPNVSAWDGWVTGADQTEAFLSLSRHDYHVQNKCRVSATDGPNRTATLVPDGPQGLNFNVQVDSKVSLWYE